VRLADVDVPDLLVDQLLGDRLLRISLELGERDERARSHVARGVGIGRVYFLRLRLPRCGEANGGDQCG
jgi:hypothetical protein